MFSRQLRMPIACGLMLFLQGCYGLDKASDATLAIYGLRSQSQDGGCGTGFSTFQSAVLPYLKANCGDCHGASITPLVGASDANLAYSSSKPFLNQANVESSILLARGKDGHCGDVGCSKDGVALLAAMKSWSSAEVGGGACGSTGPTGSTGTTGDIPNAGVLLRLNGTSLQLAASANQQVRACVPFEIVFVQDRIAAFPSKDITVDFAGEGTFQDPTCQNSILSSTIPATSNTGATIFYVRHDVVGSYEIAGYIDGYALGFTLQLNVTAAPTPSPTVSPRPSPTVSPRPSPTPSPTVSPKPSPSPTVSPKPSPTPSPVGVACTTTQKQTAFAQTVWPLAKTNCATCHTTGGEIHFGSATLTSAYSNAKAVVTITSASSSRLYTWSKNGHCGSRCSSTTGASFLTQLQRWLPAETTTNCSALTTPH